MVAADSPGASWPNNAVNGRDSNHLCEQRRAHEAEYALFGRRGRPSNEFPGARREWGWQYVFPARELSKGPRTGIAAVVGILVGTVMLRWSRAQETTGITRSTTVFQFAQRFITSFADLRQTS
jgi:hypothetical protein